MVCLNWGRRVRGGFSDCLMHDDVMNCYVYWNFQSGTRILLLLSFRSRNGGAFEIFLTFFFITGSPFSNITLQHVDVFHGLLFPPVPP